MPGILSGRKRSSDAISDEEEQSDVSSVSVGSKRARLTRDASDSPASTKGNRQTQKGTSDHVYGEEEHQPGSLVRIKVTNFVTYTAAEFHFGPSLNMIIGPNGTGKSTVVCAICLGLGWKTEHLGRAKEIGEFVKHGQPEAQIEIELAAGENQRTNPIIRRHIRKEGNKSAFFINNRPAAQKEVIALARGFSIQIDNLCQFLPQDRVVEFAKLDPIALLRETQRAAAPEHMVQWHDQLKELRMEEKRLQVQQKNEDQHLKDLQAKQNATREDVERWNQRQDLIIKSRTLEKCRPIITMNILRAEIRQITNDLRTSNQELEQFKAEVEPARRAQMEMEGYRDEIARVAKSRKERFEAGKGVADRLTSRIDAEQQSLGGFSAEIEAEKQAEKQRRIDMKRIEGEITRLHRAMEDKIVDYDHSAFESRKTEIRSKKSAAERRLNELMDTVRSVREEVQGSGGLQENLRLRRTEREQLNTQTVQKANLLKTLAPDTASAWAWLEKNMASLPLKDTVYAPAIISCSVPDSRLAEAVESQLRPHGDMTAFTCTNAEDAKVVQDKLLKKQEDGGLGLHQITIRTATQPRAFYRSPLTQAELESLGFDSWIIDHIQGPGPVLAMLCDSAKIHRAAFASQPISNEQYAALPKDILRFVSGAEVYQIARRSEYNASSTNVTRLKPARFFTDQPVDTEERRRLDEQIVDLERDIAHRKEVHKGTLSEITSTKAQVQEAEEQRAAIQAEQDALKKAHAEWEALPRKIAAKEAELDGVQALSTETRSRIQAIQEKSEKASLKVAVLTLEYAKAVTQLRVLHESHVEAEIRLIEANSEVDGYKADNADILQALRRKETEIKELENRKRTQKAEYTKLLTTAQRIISGVTEAEKAIIQEFRELTSTQDLDNEIAAVDSRLELMTEGNPNAIKAYEKREQDIQTAQEKLDGIAENLEASQEKIKEIRDQWEPELDHLVAKISDGFSHNFEQIGCAGQVGVYKDEDFENWSIQIQVRFRENESLSVLDSHRQSGGERAVSTIFYLMALQDLARSPFRVVDEINQGMDPRNERMVHERMVDIACRERTSQYFLITPKLLNNLKFHPKMKVHCIASGEHMPDQRTDLNFQTLALRALRVRKPVMAAA